MKKEEEKKGGGKNRNWFVLIRGLLKREEKGEEEEGGRAALYHRESRDRGGFPRTRPRGAEAGWSPSCRPTIGRTNTASILILPAEANGKAVGPWRLQDKSISRTGVELPEQGPPLAQLALRIGRSCSRGQLQKPGCMLPTAARWAGRLSISSPRARAEQRKQQSRARSWGRAGGRRWTVPAREGNAEVEQPKCQPRRLSRLWLVHGDGAGI